MPRICTIRIIESLSSTPIDDLTKSRVPLIFDADLDWVRKRGVAVERVNQEGHATDQRPNNPDEILTGLQQEHSLPIVVVDGKVALSGRYPTREEMGIWMMFGLVLPEEKNAGTFRSCTL